MLIIFWSIVIVLKVEWFGNGVVRMNDCFLVVFVEGGGLNNWECV